MRADELTDTMGSVLDMMQTGMTALGPMLMGFAREPEAQMFHAQAVVEAAIVAATDWDSTEGMELAGI